MMENVEESDDHWDNRSTTKLLALYLENVEKFRDPNVRKRSIWIEIGNTLGKNHDNCDKKFRNLKQTYVRLLKKKNQYENFTISWPHFKVFEDIYNINGQYQPEIEQKLQEGSGEKIAKVLLSSSSNEETQEYESEVPGNESAENESAETEALKESSEIRKSSIARDKELRRRMLRKRHSEFRKVTCEMRGRQRIVEQKLDRLIRIVEESNNIQRVRNRLFEQFLEKLNETE